jgi:hypothetical protein
MEELLMECFDLERAVAAATGESIAEIRRFGFSLLEPQDANYEPEPRRPYYFDWDTRSPVEWPLR